MDYLKPYTYLTRIIECGNYSEASSKLNISQPALSKYIKSLEIQLGIELIDRNSSPLALTKAGQCYVETARKIVDADEQFQKRLNEIKEAKNDKIRIGISPSRAPYLLPNIISTFCESSQAVIIIEEGTTDELTDKLNSGQLDLIISLLDDKTSLFEHTTLFEEELLLVAPIDTEIKDLRELLEFYPLISFGNGQPIWTIINSMQRQFDKKPEIECQNLITAISLVESNCGVTIVPSYMRDYTFHNSTVRFYKIPDKIMPSKREVCIFYRQEQYLSNAEKEFIESALKAISFKIKSNQ